jgi:hypothetical protein
MHVAIQDAKKLLAATNFAYIPNSAGKQWWGHGVRPWGEVQGALQLNPCHPEARDPLTTPPLVLAPSSSTPADGLLLEELRTMRFHSVCSD